MFLSYIGLVNMGKLFDLRFHRYTAQPPLIGGLFQTATKRAKKCFSNTFPVFKTSGKWIQRTLGWFIPQNTLPWQKCNLVFRISLLTWSFRKSEWIDKKSKATLIGVVFAVYMKLVVRGKQKNQMPLQRPTEAFSRWRPWCGGLLTSTPRKSDYELQGLRWKYLYKSLLLD